jgi:hypothetical protein
MGPDLLGGDEQSARTSFAQATDPTRFSEIGTQGLKSAKETVTIASTSDTPTGNRSQRKSELAYPNIKEKRFGDHSSVLFVLKLSTEKLFFVVTCTW